MALEGRLEDLSLADVCQLLAMGRKTGCLTVTDRSRFGQVYLEAGRVVSAHVLSRPDRLGDLLIRKGALTRDELSKAMQYQARTPGLPLGRALADLGILESEELVRYITLHVSEAVYHLFTWEEGAFHFEADARPHGAGAIPVSINTEGLLLEGARRVDEWSFIQKKVPSMESLVIMERSPQEGEEEVQLTAEQERLLPLMDGTLSVGELADRVGLVEFDAAKAVFGLIQAGFARRLGERAKAGALDQGTDADHHLNQGITFQQAGMRDDAAREFEAAVTLDPGHSEARARLALLELQNGRPERVLDHYAQAPPAVKGSYQALRLRALALEILESYDEALALLDRAAELRPREPEVHLARGVLLFKSRRTARAVEAFRRYREGVPAGVVPDPAFHGFAALAAAAEGDWEGALGLAREGLSQHRDPVAVLVGLGGTLGPRNGVFADASPDLISSIQKTPPRPSDRRRHPRRRASDTPPAESAPLTPQLPRFPELESEYLLLRELGKGGTSAVYMARERELSRFVAIKVLLPPFRRDEEAGNRIVQEARILGRLQHPNLIMLLGVRRIREGRLALILQYVSGTTLRETLTEEGPLPFHRIRSVLRDIGKALDYTHQHGVVHRDVKPENIYLEEKSGIARLSDFGNARLRNRHTGMTVPERAEGTPAFMSPEQVEGRALDQRSDLYSLGLVAYEMLTGHQPWAGEGLYGTLLKQRSEELPSLTALRPDTPPELQVAVERALAKDPGERWEGVREFLSALETVPTPLSTPTGPRREAGTASTPAPARGSATPSARRPGPVPAEATRRDATAAGTGPRPLSHPDSGDWRGRFSWVPPGLQGFARALVQGSAAVHRRASPVARTGADALVRGGGIFFPWLWRVLATVGMGSWRVLRAGAIRVANMGELALLLLLVFLFVAVLFLLDTLGFDLLGVFQASFHPDQVDSIAVARSS
jgi:serine/threonine protein kinase/Tfp pilus assembly protein PilF